MEKNSMKLKKIYCPYCGKENDMENKVCSFCKKNLNEKDHEFRDYLKDKLKDEVTGNIEDNLFSYLSAFLKKYLYGILVSISIIASVTTIFITKDTSSDTIVAEKPLFEPVSKVAWLDGCWENQEGGQLKLVAFNNDINVDENDKWFVISEDETSADFYYENYNIGSGSGTTFTKNEDGSWTFEDGLPVVVTTTYRKITCDAVPSDILTYVAIHAEDVPPSLNLRS